MPVRVALAEDNSLLLRPLSRLLDDADEVELISISRDGEQLREAIDALMPDVVVTDIRMPPSMSDEGLRIATELRTTHPDIGIVVLSAHCEPAYALALVESGREGRGYLLKEHVHHGRRLITAILAVARGDSAIDPTVVEAMLRYTTPTDVPPGARRPGPDGRSH